MNAVGAVTLLAVAVVVGALAITLIKVALVLKHVNETLDTVIGAVGGIEQATRPITPILTSIAGDLAATQKALEDLLAKKSAPAAAKPVMVSRLRQRGA
jgi:uncharacterized protein YoxC